MLALEYAPSADSTPRYGYGRPPHPELAALIGAADDRYREVLSTIASYREDLHRIPAQAGDELQAHWLNPWLLGLDTASRYTFVRQRRPRRYVEVGSGNSTLWARRAIDDGGLSTIIVSIDPSPRANIDAVCDHVCREPLELTDLSIFTSLEPGDVVFVDGSHRVFTNSDATVFFVDVLPRLPAVILVAVHDVFLPFDYLPEWNDRHYSEQYLFAAYRLGGGAPRRNLSCRVST